MKRIRQINNYYCGPATLQMLLNFQKAETDQVEIIKSIGITDTKAKKHGVAMEELAWATKILFPGLSFWYKRDAAINELSKLVNKFRLPVGVDWQGLFEYEEDEGADDDDDVGHFSVITGVNTLQNYVMIADPYKHYVGKDRNFTILEFERRWWDISTIIDPKTKKPKQIDDYHLMFVVTKKEQVFPEKLGMKKT